MFHIKPQNLLQYFTIFAHPMPSNVWMPWWFWMLSSWGSTILARPSSCHGSWPLLWIYWNSTRWSWQGPDTKWSFEHSTMQAEGRRPWEALRWRVGCCFEQHRDNGPQISSNQWPFSTAGSSTVRYVEAFGVRHKDVQFTTIVPLLRRLERLFKKCSVSTCNLWKPGDGNQRLDLVIRDYLEMFREIVRDPCVLLSASSSTVSINSEQWSGSVARRRSC